MNIKNELEQIILLINNDSFVKAHDALELLWRKYKNDNSTRQESFILKAFVNATISFEIYSMKRYSHYDNLWNTYKKYEALIEQVNSENIIEYKRIKKLIYEKKEKYIK